MEKTQIAEYIDQPGNSYVYVALLSVALRTRISELLQNLQQTIGDGLYTMPGEALHITLCEVIESKPYSQNVQQMYDERAQSLIDVPARILQSVTPISVHFNSIEVSPQAIIIRGKDTGSFAAIRAALATQLPLPPETKQPPTIIHCSIARFTKAIDLERVKELASDFTIDEQETIQAFHLVHTTRLPFSQYTVIRSFPLTA